MTLFQGKTPAERNKMIAAIVLPVIALVFIIYMFSGPSKPNNVATSPTPKPTPKRTPGLQGSTPQPDMSDDIGMIVPISCCAEPYGGSDAGRNIFAFYEKPKTAEVPTASITPLPTPTPTPPLVLASLAPQSVFAMTGNFTLQVSGDKFGPAARVFIDGQEVPTQY